jgi:hypothetical protein
MANDWKQIVTAAQTVAGNTAKISEYAQLNEIAPMHTLLSDYESSGTDNWRRQAQRPQGLRTNLLTSRFPL